MCPMLTKSNLQNSLNLFTKVYTYFGILVKSYNECNDWAYNQGLKSGSITHLAVPGQAT